MSADDVIVYIENPTDSKKLLDLINEFGKIAGYKVNIQKSKAFLYTNNEISETEIRKKYSIWYRKKKNKIPNNKPNRGGRKNLYSENCTTLKKELRKELKGDTNTWKHILCSWIRRINIIKMAILPKAIFRFNAICTEVQMTYFTYRTNT